MKKKMIVVVIFFTLLLNLAPSQAVTFGEEVISASNDYPSVVSIWYTTSTSQDPIPYCTGTLIESDIVLTAAHCVEEVGVYFIKYGTDLRKDSYFRPVSATWKSPNFSSDQLVGDVGLLKLTDPIIGAQTTPLLSSSAIKKVMLDKKKRLEIVGWGKDQNSILPQYLKKLTVDDYSAAMKKKYRNQWRDAIWIAVGKYDKKQKIYAGSCNGDSGGPLFAYSKGQEYLVAVTSWGAEDCEDFAPSVYTRLTAYSTEIQSKGLKFVRQNELTQNRSFPSVIVAPSISGTPAKDSVITCDKGTWSSNTTSVTISWYGGNMWAPVTTPSLILGQVYSPTTYRCTVVGKNSNGEVVRVLSITQPKTPTIPNTPYPSISGISSYSNTAVGTVAQCSASNYSTDATMSYQWGYGTSSYVSSLSNPLGSGSTLTISQSILDTVKGKYLICQATATNSAGSSSGFSTQSVTGPTPTPTPTPTPSSSPTSSPTPTPTPSSSPTSSPTSSPNGDCIPHPMVGVCANEPKLITSRVDEGVNNTTYFHTILVSCIGDKSLLTQATLQFSGPYAPITFTCGVEQEYGGFSSFQTNVTASIRANGYNKTSPTHNLSQSAPKTYTSAATLPVIKSVSITGLSAGQELSSSTVFTCTANLSNNDFSYITYTWMNSNRPEPATYSPPHQETVFVSGYKSTSTSHNFAVSGEGNIPLLKGLYLECLVRVYRISDGRGVGSSTKIKIP